MQFAIQEEFPHAKEIPMNLFALPDAAGNIQLTGVSSCRMQWAVM
jgi:hypothetical protein